MSADIEHPTAPGRPPPITAKSVLSSISAFSAAWMVIMGTRYFAQQAGDINGALGIGVDTGSWLSTAYAISEPLGVLVGAWLGIIFSLRRMLMFGVSTFLIGSLIPLMVSNYDAVFASRIVTGLAAGIIMPQAIIVQIRSWGPTRSLIAIALFLSAPTAAPLAGGIIAAWSVERYGWTAILWAALPLGLLALATGWVGLERQAVAWRTLIHADVAGALSLGMAIALFSFAISQGDRLHWSESRAIVASLAAAAACLAYFTLQDRRAVRHPILWVDLLSRRNIALALMGVLPLTLAISLSGTIVPFALSQLQSFRPEQTSTVLWAALWPQPFSFVLCFWILNKKLLEQRAMIVFGFGILAAGALIDVTITSQWQGGEFQIGQILQGVGLPWMALPLINQFLGDLRPPAESLPAAAIFNLSRILFGNVAAAWATTSLRLSGEAKFGQLLENTAFYPAGRGSQIVSLVGKIGVLDSDPLHANAKAVAIIANVARRQAIVLGISHTLSTWGVLLFASCLIPLLMGGFGSGKALRSHNRGMKH